MSPTHGECIVVNPVAVASVFSSISSLSPSKFLQTPCRSGKNNSILIDTKNNWFQVSKRQQRQFSVVMNGSIGSGGGSSGHHHNKKPNRSSKPKLGGNDENDESLLAEMCHLTLQGKKDDGKGNMKAKGPPPASLTQKSPQVEKISRSPPVKGDERLINISGASNAFSKHETARTLPKDEKLDSAFYGDDDEISTTLPCLRLKSERADVKNEKEDKVDENHKIPLKSKAYVSKSVEKLEVSDHAQVAPRKCFSEEETRQKNVSANNGHSAPPTTAGRKLFIKPKDIINSSRQKSLILAHKSKTASAPQVPHDIVTQDLLGTNLKKCRDNKNVDDLAKALSVLNVKKTVVSDDLLAGERIQRSPIPVQVGPNRRTAIAPYSTQAAPHNRNAQEPSYDQTYNNRSQLSSCYENQQTSAFYDQSAFAYNSISSSPSYVQVRTIYSPAQYENICSPPCWPPQQSKNDETVPPQPFGAAISSDQTFGPKVEQQQKKHFSSCSYEDGGQRISNSCAISFDDQSKPQFTTPRNQSTLLKNNSACSYELTADHNGNRLERNELSSISPEPQIDELPETLTDFILNYSWKETNAEKEKLKSDDLVVESESCSPFLADMAPDDSPAAPQGANRPGSPTGSSHGSDKSHLDTTLTVKITVPGKFEPQQVVTENDRQKSIRQKFRAMIKNDEFNRSWLWALRCTQESPGALYYRDADGDSFLHIVVWQKDMAKIYSLTEMMKNNNTHQIKPFDLKNKLNETPLFLAVEKRLKEVVAYGLENCTNPNIQAFNREQDAPLHYAATRGMTGIVQVLCECPLVNVDMPNGVGLSPLLCAVKNHRNTEEENQSLVDNKAIVSTLLKFGADAKCHDTITGKTLLHYAVECMDPEMIRIFRDHLDKELLHQLVNQPCYAGQTPLELLTMIENTRGIDYSGTEEGQIIRIEMGRVLAELGAELPRMTAGSGTESPDFYFTYDTFFP